MNLPLWVSELAAAFWKRARLTEPFPRNLRRPIARAVPLAIVLLPRLSVGTVIDRLKLYGLSCRWTEEDRMLRACLVARHGYGVAFIDGTDDDAEQRFSIAHELAHFLRDYWSVRQRVSKRLGLAALEAFDGKCSATTSEYLHALIRNMPLDFHLHLLERDEDGEPLSPRIAQAELDADRLAYELLAPVEHVFKHGPAENKRQLTRQLQDSYGLPAAQASRYADILLPVVRTDPLLRRMLSIV